MCKSTKQKLNTKSSTEAELIGASDYLPNTIWARMFLESQGYAITENIFAQDNKSAILLERNGRSSSGQKTRHIDIRYFFIKDRLISENITVRHCPTESMLADFFTKPLQGALFRTLRSVILGYEHISILDQHSTTFSDPAPTITSSFPFEERVGAEKSPGRSNVRSEPSDGQTADDKPSVSARAESARAVDSLQAIRNEQQQVQLIPLG